MDINLANYSYTAKMMIILFCASFFFSMIFLVKYLEVKDEKEDSKTKIKNKGNKKYKDKLADYIKKKNEDVEKQRGMYDRLGEDVPAHLLAQKMVMNTLVTDNPGKYLTILILGVLFGIGASAVMMYSANPAVVPIIFLIYALGTLTVINSMRTVDNYRKYKETVDLITLIHTNYQNRDSIIDAMLDLQSSLIPLDPKKGIVDDFVNNVTNINVDLDRSLDIMAESLTDIAQVRQYFSIIKKAENTSKSIKSSLNDIPENLSLMSVSRKDYTGAIAMVGIFVVLSLIGFTFKVVYDYSPMNPNLETIVANFPKVIAGSIIYLVSMVIAYVTTKVRKN